MVRRLCRHAPAPARTVPPTVSQHGRAHQRRRVPRPEGPATKGGRHARRLNPANSCKRGCRAGGVTRHSSQHRSSATRRYHARGRSHRQTERSPDPMTGPRQARDALHDTAEQMVKDKSLSVSIARAIYAVLGDLAGDLGPGGEIHRLFDSFGKVHPAEIIKIGKEFPLPDGKELVVTITGPFPGEDAEIRVGLDVKTSA